MRQRVGGEDLGAENEEVADQAGGHRDGGTGEERVLHERMREHRGHPPTGASRAASRVRAAVVAKLSA